MIESTKPETGNNPSRLFIVFLPLVYVGRLTISICLSTGKFCLFAINIFRNIFSLPIYLQEIVQQLLSIGFFSLPVIGMTALFAGGALALQVYSGGTRFNAESAVPAIVAIGMIRELGPVLCGLMIAGRVGSSIAAEIATMKVSEQVDALTTLSINPIKYLVVPRVIASIIALPILTGICDIIGILGGYLVGTGRLGFSTHWYIAQSLEFLGKDDVISSLIKGGVFGFIVAISGGYFGMNAIQGARGVGRATVKAVATASILIIALNFVLTDLFF